MNTNAGESSLTKVPVELWTEIFWLATAIAGKDDLSYDGLAYDILPREETGISSVYSHSKLSFAHPLTKNEFVGSIRF
jgi:hypothetical protein